MLKSVTGFLVNMAERWMPDPLVIAIFLTLLCSVAAVLFTDFTVLDTVDAWGDGFWNLLKFTNQIILILALGHIVAHTKPVNNALIWVAHFIKSPTMAYSGLFFIAGACALISWGLGLVVPAVLSRIVAGNCRDRGVAVHFPLLVAAGYGGGIVGMQGLSASIPLILNTPGHFLEEKIGLIGLEHTIFSPWSIGIVLAILIIMPIILPRLAPSADKIIEMPARAKVVEEKEPTPREHMRPSEKLETSRWITLCLAAIAGVYIVRYFIHGGGLNLNSLNMSFVALGLLFADSPRHYIQLLGNAARVIGPFLIQYPLYAALMGIISTSGLGTMIVNGFVSVADADTLSLWTFFSAGFLNLAIPSAGGQWAVQGPIITEAALQLGADIPRAAMAVAIGEVWTNAIQPLYAIPVLAIAGLHIKDIMGYSIIGMMVTGAIYLTALTFF